MFLLHWISYKFFKNNKSQEYLQHYFSEYLIPDVYNGFNRDDFLKKDRDGFYTFRGRPLTNQEFINLKEDAIRFQESDLWKILRDEMEYRAALKLLHKSRNEADLLFAKAMMFNAELIINKLEDITQL